MRRRRQHAPEGTAHALPLHVWAHFRLDTACHAPVLRRRQHAPDGSPPPPPPPTTPTTKITFPLQLDMGLEHPLRLRWRQHAPEGSALPFCNWPRPQLPLCYLWG